jgi:hypothetical protein
MVLRTLPKRVVRVRHKHITTLTLSTPKLTKAVKQLIGLNLLDKRRLGRLRLLKEMPRNMRVQKREPCV